MKDVFSKEVTDEVIARINKLTAETQPEWGKMSVGQMLAHCSVAYEYVFDNTYKKPKGLKKFIMVKFIKPMIVSEKGYKQNGPTSPDFKMTTPKEFETEKKRLIDYIERTQALGGDHFHNTESHAFGVLTKEEWNRMFYKHLNHHLTQFGV